MQLRAIPFLGLAVLLAAAPAHAVKCPRGTLIGQVTHVRDGDTIEVGTMPIRLNGLAAPEGDEAGGAAATRAMLDLVQSRTLAPCGANSTASARTTDASASATWMMRTLRR